MTNGHNSTNDHRAPSLGKPALCIFKRSSLSHLSYHHRFIIKELVIRNLQVERCGAFPDTARGVIMGAMAGAVVPPVVPRVGNGDAPQVGTHADDNDPFGFCHAFRIVLGVTQLTHVNRGFRSNLLLCSMTDEQRLASPLEGHVLALWDVSQLDLDLGQSQDVSRSAHGGDKLGDYSLGCVDRNYGEGPGDHVGEGSPGLTAVLGRHLGVLNIRPSVVGEIWYFDVCVGIPNSSWG